MRKQWIILAIIVGVIAGIALIIKQNEKDSNCKAKVAELIKHADAYSEGGNTPHAKELLYKAYALDSNNLAILAALGKLHLSLNELDKSHYFIYKAMQLDSTNHHALLNMAGYHLVKLNYVTAIEYYTRALYNPPEYEKNNPDVYFLRGCTYMNLSDYEKAVSDFEKMLAYNPDHIYTHSYLTHLYAIQGRRDEAFAEIAYILTLDNIDVITCNNLSYTYNLLGNHENALHFANSGIKQDSSAGVLYNNRASALLELGRLEEAKKDLDKSLKLEPNNAILIKNLALYYQLSNQPENICPAMVGIEKLFFYKDVEKEVLKLRKAYCN